MRDIIFKAKRRDNKKWIEGYYCKYGDNDCIIEPTTFGLAKGIGVLPETIGQYTGLTDKNGKKIFEGDIVKFGDMLGIINFGFGCYCVRTNKPDWKCRNNPAIDIIFNEYPNEIEVIGNINDNPELIEVK